MRSRLTRLVTTAVAIIAVLLLTASGCVKSVVQKLDEAAAVVSRTGASSDDLLRAAREVQGLRPAELDGANAARRRQLLADLDRALYLNAQQNFDRWAQQSRQTAAEAGVYAEQELVVSYGAKFRKDLRDAAEEAVTEAVCEQLEDALYPTRDAGDESESDDLIGKALDILGQVYNRGEVGRAVEWAQWGYDASQRARRIVASLNDYPERVEQFGQPAVLRATIAKERFCDPRPGG